MIYILYIGIYYIIHEYFNKKVQNTGYSFYKDICQDNIHDIFHEILPEHSEDEWIIHVIGLLSAIPLLFAGSSI